MKQVEETGPSHSLQPFPGLTRASDAMNTFKSTHYYGWYGLIRPACSTSPVCATQPTHERSSGFLLETAPFT